MAGKVYQINLKGEVPGERGLPKRAVASARVTPSGLEGDFNRYRQERARGSPEMALLLMPLETLQQLNLEGWPVQPGDIGENITTQGVPYHDFSPGKRYKIGPAEVQVSKACDPCTNLYLLPYVGAEKGPAFLRTMMGRRGWYCSVLRSGALRRGDPIEEIP